MITRRTKVQLLIFVLITLVGVSFVGARYARLGSLFLKDHYTVVAHFAQSGGIYQGGEVDYRGVKIGQVGKLALTADGVDVSLDIDNKWDKIPSDTLAVVGNRSAVGEQYVELQPQTDAGPYLADHSQIAQQDTSTPLPTEKLLADSSRTVDSVDKKSLTVTIDELGKAFNGAGTDLGQILDTGTAFVQTANENFDVTSDLLRDSNTVLRTQMDNESAIRSFSKNLALFSGTLAGSNDDLVSLIRNGAAGATELRTFLEENRVDLSELLSEVITTGRIVQENLPGLRQVLVVYPYVVEGGFTVVDHEPGNGPYNAHFGLILTSTPPCHAGYESTQTRPPQERGDRPMNTKAHCSEPASESNARGAQNAPRAGAAYRAPVVASYDEKTGKLTWGDATDDQASGTGASSADKPAPATLGSDSWKWLYLQPLTAGK
ncbi:MlaD family protein [Nocardioides sp. KR10-350]|uniref:MlaD family protein n=1 Tax=Nocardioides cheoyonin TaxID=3156615 RepID=UPI0032B48A34